MCQLTFVLHAHHYSACLLVEKPDPRPQLSVLRRTSVGGNNWEHNLYTMLSSLPHAHARGMAKACQKRNRLRIKPLVVAPTAVKALESEWLCDWLTWLGPQRACVRISTAYTMHASNLNDVRRLFEFLGSLHALPRGGSRILQGRVSNPSERGTGGRALMGWGLGRGLCPSPENFCIPCIKMVSFMHSRWYLLTLFFSKRAP